MNRTISRISSLEALATTSLRQFRTDGLRRNESQDGIDQISCLAGHHGKRRKTRSSSRQWFTCLATRLAIVSLGSGGHCRIVRSSISHAPSPFFVLIVSGSLFNRRLGLTRFDAPPMDRLEKGACHKLAIPSRLFLYCAGSCFVYDQS